MEQVRALFVCNSKSTHAHGTNLTFHATQGDTGEESKSFNDATPGGNLDMHIAPGKEAADYFEEGSEYYLTFEKRSK